MSASVGGVDVSRETIERLETHLSLLRKWTQKINLVASGSVKDGWTRHIEDSAQLFPLIPEEAKTLADFGSGGGFPGVVLAILARDLRPDLDVILVESDARKAAFLRTVLNETEVEAELHVERILDLAPVLTDVMTARALAPLEQLCAVAEHHMASEGTAILPKGRNAEDEIETALERWTFACEKIPSRTDDDAVILKLRDIHRA